MPGIVLGTWDSSVNTETVLFHTENIPLSGILFIHLPAEGYLGCFQVLAIMNKAAINICVQVLLCTLSVLWILAISIGM